MTRTQTRTAFAALLLVIPPLTIAGPGKAGLWEVTTSLNFGVGGFQVDPEQIEQMRQLGIEVPGLSRPFVARQCITPAQAAGDGLPSPQTGDSDCALRNVRHKGAVWNADIVCAGSLQGSGALVARFDNAERFAGTWSFRGRSAELPAEVEMSNPYSGRWLAASCAQTAR